MCSETVAMEIRCSMQGHRCTSEFLCILKKIASHFHLTSLEFPCVQMWQLKSKATWLLSSPGVRCASRCSHEPKEYTMDFQVLTPCSTESREPLDRCNHMNQQILASRNQHGMLSLHSAWCSAISTDVARYNSATPMGSPSKKPS